MPERAGAWTLQGFAEHLDIWERQEPTTADLRNRVILWIMTRSEDPYQGVRRESGFDNLWFGPIPGTQHDRWMAVTCSYWIYESTRTVKCDSIVTLGWPF